MSKVDAIGSEKNHKPNLYEMYTKMMNEYNASKANSGSAVQKYGNSLFGNGFASGCSQESNAAGQM